MKALHKTRKRKFISKDHDRSLLQITYPLVTLLTRIYCQMPTHMNINEIKMWFKRIIISSFESNVSFSINNMIFYSFVICIIYTYIVYLFVRYSLPFLKTPMPFFSLLTNEHRLPPRHPVKNSSFYWMIYNTLMGFLLNRLPVVKHKSF